MKLKYIRSYQDGDPNLGGAALGYAGDGIMVARWILQEKQIGTAKKWARIQEREDGDIVVEFLDETDDHADAFPLIHLDDGSAKILVPTSFSAFPG